MNQPPFRLGLVESWLAATCGKAVPQHVSDDSAGFETALGLDMRADKPHGAVQDGSGLLKGKNALVEKCFDQGGGDGSPGNC
jgi:hypothetical protein